MIIIPFDGEGNRDPERLSNLPKATKLGLESVKTILCLQSAASHEKASNGGMQSSSLRESNQLGCGLTLWEEGLEP